MSFFGLFSSKKKAQPHKSISSDERLAEKAVIESEEPLFTVSHRRIDPDENIPPIKGAALSYLDAEALKFWNKKRTDFKIPDYYSDSAFGRNVGPALRRLLDGGYLDLGGIRKSIELKQVPELKAILAERGLKVSGRKAELIQRITDNFNDLELEDMFPVRVYEVTEKGESALDEYSIFFDNESLGLGFPYYRLVQEKGKDRSSSNEAIFTRLFAENINKAAKGEPEQYRIEVEKFSRFLDMTGRPTTAMQYHCLSFFMSWYRNTVTLGVQSRPEVYAYEAKRIDHCGQMCGYSLEQTLQEFQRALKEHNPFGLCTNRNINLAIETFKSAISVR